MPWLVLTVVLLAFILLTVASRSIVIATKAAVLKRVITTAGVIKIPVFTSFVLDPDPTVKMLAIGMAAAVLIDASVIRMILSQQSCRYLAAMPGGCRGGWTALPPT